MSCDLSGAACVHAAQRSLGPVVVGRVRVRFVVRALGERVLAQQAPQLVIAQPQQLRGRSLLELRALERALEQLLLELGDGLAEVVRQLVIA